MYTLVNLTNPFKRTLTDLNAMTHTLPYLVIWKRVYVDLTWI